jgi:hypothetical protein
MTFDAFVVTSNTLRKKTRRVAYVQV